jgi:nicotinate-nucleotide adenylyltransferase
MAPAKIPRNAAHTMRKKVGILGGSFDPIHFGHLNLAISMMEACVLDEVLFVPAFLSPFKQNAPPVASAEHRKEMLKLATDPVKTFRILDWELQSKGPTFTIDTVHKLSSDPSLQLHLILGEDHMASFHRWKEAEDLIRLASPLIGTRERGDLSQLSVRFQDMLHNRRVKIPHFEISSTDVRSRLSQKKYCGHLVPSAVLDYIDKHHLY